MVWSWGTATRMDGGGKAATVQSPASDWWLRTLAGNLPAPAKKLLSETLSKFAPQIEDLVKQVSGMPGVDGILKPALEKITGQLGALKGAG